MARFAIENIGDDVTNGLDALSVLIGSAANLSDEEHRRRPSTEPACSASRLHGWTLALSASVVLLLSAAAVLTASRDFVLLIGDTAILQAPTVALCAWAAAVLILLVLTGTILLRYRRHHRGPTRELLTIVALLLAVSTAGLWTIGASVLNAGTDAANEARLTAVPASKALACAVVSDETSTLNSSSVRLYPIGRFGIGTPTLPTTYGRREFPIAAGDYSQTPFPHGGVLRLTTQRPSELQALPFRCPEF